MRQYLIFRLLISVLGFVLIAFHIAWLAPGSSYSAVAFLYTALTAYFFAAVAFQVTFRRWQAVQWMYHLQAPFDLVVIGALIWATGGVVSVLSPVLFVFLAAATGITSPRGALGLATLAALILSSATFAQGHGLVPTGSSWLDWGIIKERSGLASAFVVANVLGLYVIGSLGSKLSHGLRDSEELQEEITQAIGEGLIAVDRFGRLIRLNREACRLLGIHLELEPHSHLLLEEVVFDAPTDADLEGRRAIANALRDGSPTRFETTLVGIDARSRPVLVKTSTVTDDKDRLRCRVAVISDLTLEREIAAAERRIEKLEELQVMALGIAHEIRNPLASIRGCVQEIVRSVPPSPTSGTLARIVLKESDRLDRIVEDFLAYARGPSSRPQPVELLGLIEETVLLLRQRGDL
ncbi:MAG TPA: histidine kinase dimerization/phospho-acceptor domain-containing protein, partial [Planctomycetota bacterium]|nr:histidine kinase dimerization/phospho-acceptor domain-containing protein [Planctomycetota bacterium]